MNKNLDKVKQTFFFFIIHKIPEKNPAQNQINFGCYIAVMLLICWRWKALAHFPCTMFLFYKIK